MTLEYVKIPVAVLELDGLCLAQKILLAMVLSFSNRGLKMSNAALGKLLNIRPDTVSKMLADLAAKGYIEIANKQSRWRVIYFGEKSKVGNALLGSLDRFTLEKNATYFGENSKQNIRSKESKGYAPVPPCDDPTEEQVEAALKAGAGL